MSERLEKQFVKTFAALQPEAVIIDSHRQMIELMLLFYNYLEDFMDKQIRKIEKENKKESKDLKDLEKADKKRDKVCDYGEKMIKAKKKKTKSK